ncbi:hypothetical protein V8G54_003894 [Vigna mungo]|uniref:Uncharacterized protein n=1 Tax=Vigna mungo TaxID=3915 RepID=A0AAQ3PB92_VIGMU
MSTNHFNSAWCFGSACTFMSINSRSTCGSLERSSTFKTLTSFWSCSTTWRSTLSVPDTTMVKSALSSLRPTASDSILYPLRAKTPAILFIIPLSSPTNTEIVCRRTFERAGEGGEGGVLAETVVVEEVAAETVSLWALKV